MIKYYFSIVEEDQGGFGMGAQMPKMGTKKRLKMEMKAEKRAMREVSIVHVNDNLPWGGVGGGVE